MLVPPLFQAWCRLSVWFWSDLQLIRSVLNLSTRTWNLLRTSLSSGSFLAFTLFSCPLFSFRRHSCPLWVPPLLLPEVLGASDTNNLRHSFACFQFSLFLTISKVRLDGGRTDSACLEQTDVQRSHLYNLTASTLRLSWKMSCCSHTHRLLPCLPGTWNGSFHTSNAPQMTVAAAAAVRSLSQLTEWNVQLSNWKSFHECVSTVLLLSNAAAAAACTFLLLRCERRLTLSDRFLMHLR